MVRKADTTKEQGYEVFAEPVKIPINVSPEHLERAREFHRGAVRSAIIEPAYHTEAGALAGHLADLKALDEVEPTAVEVFAE